MQDNIRPVRPSDKVNYKNKLYNPCNYLFPLFIKSFVVKVGSGLK